jgi:hypothetical protein
MSGVNRLVESSAQVHNDSTLPLTGWLPSQPDALRLREMAAGVCHSICSGRGSGKKSEAQILKNKIKFQGSKNCF